MKKESCGAITNPAAFLLKIFLASVGRMAVTEGGSWGLGVSLNKHFGWCNLVKIAKHVYVCITCQPVLSKINTIKSKNFLL